MTNTQVSEPINQGQKSDLFRAEDSKPHTSHYWLIFSGGLVLPKREENIVKTSTVGISEGKLRKEGRFQTKLWEQRLTRPTSYGFKQKLKTGQSKSFDFSEDKSFVSELFQAQAWYQHCSWQSSAWQQLLQTLIARARSNS